MITRKNVISTVPRTLYNDENTITKPCEIAEKQNINYSHKHFSENLKHQCNNSIFLQAADTEEIANILSSLHIIKASGPFSIPNKLIHSSKTGYF